jgi:hypothetical protein
MLMKKESCIFSFLVQNSIINDFQNEQRRLEDTVQNF